MASADTRSVAVLGSTGSIGTSTLEVVSSLPGLRLSVHSLACGNNIELLAGQVAEHSPRRVVIQNPEAAERFKSSAPADLLVESGPDALVSLASDPEVDIVVMAVVGAAALRPTLAALEAGKTVALANKECLVMAGRLVTAAARSAGGRIIPVDSEHSAAFQVMMTGRASEIHRLVITGSGGALRDVPLEELPAVSPARALDHPTWDMGPKVTIDSATSMNKALELIEAHYLFGLPSSSLGVWLHPQSIIHAAVQYVDGTTVLHASLPDMRLPIQYALGLTGPGRVPGLVPVLPVDKLSDITLSEPDPARMPAVELGLQVCEQEGTLGAVLNAANEVAVDAFLARGIPFTSIIDTVRAVMSRHSVVHDPNLEEVLAADAWARRAAAGIVGG
ncbi:MAG: 1-deoxy-D-xylulose-5-phosphate reductoisomerase [Planctomycetes bacterium]|nr:1-deoxy-D-xylulose-5-phosphate reductoisomerase [Planctomycetota bacterium]